jgi:NAD(P)-dependent dehydrogenase (short-subunit alcohol dehydrogenase family)
VCQFSISLDNNAAARHRDSLLAVSTESWNRVLAVNLTGALVCTQAFSRHMIDAEQGGSIVHVGSILGHNPQVDNGAYSVSKAGLMMLSRVLCLELAQYGIRSNVVSPGFTRTPANEASYRDPETAAARQRMIPSGRVADAVDLAHVIAFLASDRADYINGHDIVVDGGASNMLLGRVPRADGKP